MYSYLITQLYKYRCPPLRSPPPPQYRRPPCTNRGQRVGAVLTTRKGCLTFFSSTFLSAIMCLAWGRRAMKDYPQILSELLTKMEPEQHKFTPRVIHDLHRCRFPPWQPHTVTMVTTHCYHAMVTPHCYHRYSDNYLISLQNSLLLQHLDSIVLTGSPMLA